MGPELAEGSVVRPWGGFLVLDEGTGYKVKKIWVKPNEILSLQLHNSRDEHWVVVMGKGEVTLGEETFLKAKNETAFIPKETKHRMANPGPGMLEFIEVQLGEYLGEDDIVRFEDKYHR